MVALTDLSILLVAITWGSSYVVMQTVGSAVPAAGFLALRFAAAIPVIALLALRTLPQLTSSEVRNGIAFGFMLYGILILETIGVLHTSAANSGFLITVSVVLVPVLERVLSRRAQPLPVYLATVTALVGCGLLLLSRGGFHPQSGDLIILAAAMIRATQITLFGRSSEGQNQSLVNITLIEFVVVLLLATATSVLTGAPMWRLAGAVSGSNWLLIAYLGVIGTSFAFFAQLRGARRTSSTRVGLILCTEPVFSTLFAVLVAGEQLTVVQMLGGALVVGSAIVGRSLEGARKVPARVVAEPSRHPLRTGPDTTGSGP
ncbi:DMT family transporter [Nocardia brasiliensis]|uniref:DMT family transporter n=1 Tax=Nocardia brasiliensis TaxID=37326 RepID=UPI002457AC22|nr:EamA family transporter [Nocardia brasiliensis]